MFDAAIDGCRARTLEHIALPAGESFTIEYVTDKSWSGYNWYQGNYRSLIQINTDLPIYIDRAIDLACHEGYPGHHVYNVLLEQQLVRGRGWQEYSVYPLFSPQSLIAEGHGELRHRGGVSRRRAARASSATCCFRPPASMRRRSTQFYEVMALVEKLSYAGNEAARRYLDGQDRRRGRGALARDVHVERRRSAPRSACGSSISTAPTSSTTTWARISWRRYVERRAGSRSRRSAGSEFARLISSPRLPSGLAE